MSTRTFALILGIILLITGITGFIPGLTVHHAPETGMTPGDATAGPTETVAASYAYLFGLFPTNALHNLFHIAWGIFGIVAYRSIGGALSFARATAVVYAVLAVFGLIPAGVNTVWGLLPLFGHDIWLHALIALAAAYFGWVHTRNEALATDTGTLSGAAATRRP